MGSGFSAPPPPATKIEEDPYPKGSGIRGVVFGEGSLPGDISISKAKQCDPGKCQLSILPEVSTASVNVTRKFGDVSPNNCNNFANDLRRVMSGEMSVKDFLAIFQSGEYYAPTDFNLESKFCQQMKLNDDTDTTKIITPKDVNDLIGDRTKWHVSRIRSITSAGFSLDTKVILKPSVPFKMSFNGEAFEVTNMTVYHPCPVTIQDKQPDALISLNDPAIGSPKYVVLIPVTSGDSFSPSAKFFSKIAPQIATVASSNPATGLFLSTDVPTGQGWALSSLFPVNPKAEYKATPVTPGYFIWEGMPPLERYKKREDVVNWFGVNFPWFIHYAWRPVPGATTPKYIMLETPVPVAPSDLATLTRYIPITPVDNALHGIFGNVVHKPCAATPTTGVIERFEVGATCNPFLKNAINDTNDFDTNKVVTIVFGVLLGIAALIGAYLALTAVSKSWDVEYAEFSKNAGKVVGVWAKNVHGKVSALTNKVSSLSSLAKNPTAALGDISKVPTTTSRGLKGR